MDISREALIRSADKYDSLALLCAFAVAVGVAIEAVETWQKNRKGSFRKLALILAAPALVAGGVLGEWFLGVLSSWTHQKIRQMDDMEIVTQRRRAAEAELALRRIIENQSPRNLTARQKRELFKLFTRHPGVRICVRILNTDEEAREFGGQILSLLQSSGLNTSVIGIVGPFDYGVNVSISHSWVLDKTEPTFSKADAQTICSAFEKLGVSHSCKILEAPGSLSSISVGQKIPFKPLF